MAELQTLVPSILNDLNRVVRSFRMYAARHPQVEANLKSAYLVLQSLLATEESVVLGITGGTLLIQGRPVKDAATTFKPFFELFKTKNISAVRFQRGVTIVEFRDLVALLCMRPEEALESGRIAPRLLESLPHVKVNQLRYVSVTDEDVPAGPTPGMSVSQGALEVAGVLSEAGVRSRQDAVAVIDAMFMNVGEGGQPPAERMASVMNSLSGELGRLEPGAATKTARHYFELMALRGIAGRGVKELRDSMLQTVAAMSPSVRKAVLGESNGDMSDVDVFRVLRNFDPKLRSSAVVNDILHKRLDPDQVKRTLELLGPTPGEYVKLYELVSNELMQTKADSKTVKEALSRLFRALRAPSGERPTKAHGTILVLDPEEIDDCGYAEDLADLGFDVHRFGDGKKALEYLWRNNDIQCIVMEVKMPGLSGLEFLSALVQSHKTIPVVLHTRYLHLQDAFEVTSYPKLRTLAKPANLDDLRSAVEAFLPEKSAAPARKELPYGELKRAHEIQEKLIPTSFPPLAGYDLAFFYKPAHAVGGDYLDFIRLDENRTGIIVADVSGKNVPGAMVMVMLRSVFRMVASQCQGAKETLMMVNEHVTRDIPRGMFVTAMYAILDTSTHTLQVANAGHNPPLLMTRGGGMGRFVRLPGTVLGLLSGEAYERTLREEHLSFAPKDRILFYTDGVVEAMDAMGQEYTDKQLLRVVDAMAPMRSPDLVRGLVSSLERHRGVAQQHDDISIVCLTRVGK